MMNIFARHIHHHDDPWQDAPDYAIELREMLGFLIYLHLHSAGKLSDEDQKKMNTIYETATAGAKKLDDAQAKS